MSRLSEYLPPTSLCLAMFSRLVRPGRFWGLRDVKGVNQVQDAAFHCEDEHAAVSVAVLLPDNAAGPRKPTPQELLQSNFPSEAENV